MEVLKPYIDIFAEARRVPLIPGQYAFMSGAALAACGLRPTSDLDILATNRQLAVGYTLSWKHEVVIPGETVKLRRGNVRFLSDLHVRRGHLPDTHTLIARAVTVNGFSVLRLRDVYRFKRALYNARGKRKDLNDAELLERYFARKANTTKRPEE